MWLTCLSIMGCRKQAVNVRLNVFLLFPPERVGCGLATLLKKLLWRTGVFL